MCGTTVIRSLMRIHLDWHASEDGPGEHFRESASEPSLDQVVRVIAALKALPPISARAEFVAKLRRRVLAAADGGRARADDA